MVFIPLTNTESTQSLRNPITNFLSRNRSWCVNLESAVANHGTEAIGWFCCRLVMEWLCCELTGADQDVVYFVCVSKLPTFFKKKSSWWSIAKYTASCSNYGLWTLTDFSSSLFNLEKKKNLMPWILTQLHKPIENQMLPNIHPNLLPSAIMIILWQDPQMQCHQTDMPHLANFVPKIYSWSLCHENALPSLDKSNNSPRCSVSIASNSKNCSAFVLQTRKLVPSNVGNWICARSITDWSESGVSGTPAAVTIFLARSKKLWKKRNFNICCSKSNDFFVDSCAFVVSAPTCEFPVPLWTPSSPKRP